MIALMPYGAVYIKSKEEAAQFVENIHEGCALRNNEDLCNTEQKHRCNEVMDKIVKTFLQEDKEEKSMVTVAELRNMPIEKSAEMVLKDLEMRIIAARHMPPEQIFNSIESNTHVVDLPWGYPKDLTNVVLWELLKSGYDVSFYHVDGGLRINIKYFT